MPPAQRSVGRFCSVTTKDLTSLADLDAVDLGVGAQAYVLSTKTSYRFSGSGFGTLSPIAIGALGGGTWFEENPVKDQSYNIFATGASPDATAVLNTWRALPTGTALYSEGSPKASWSVNTSVPQMLYSGPTAVFVVTGVFCVKLIDHADNWEFDLSLNGASIGSTTTLATSTRSGSDNVAGLVFARHTSPPITVAAGQTLQHMVRDVTATTTFDLIKYQALIELLP